MADSISYRINLNDRAFAELVASGGQVDRISRQVAGRVRDRAREIVTSEGRVDSGRLRQSIVSERISSIASAAGGSVTYKVGSELKYAVWQHDGVRGPIRPRRARVLRFKPSGQSSYVFRPSVAGFKGIKFLTRAGQDISRRLG